jgi:hypothetical protein
LGVFEDDFEFGMFVSGGFDLGVHFDAPRLAEIALGHADDVAHRRDAGVGFGLAASFRFFAAGECERGSEEKEFQI